MAPRLSVGHLTPFHADYADKVIECQCDFAIDTIKALRITGAKSIEPTIEAEDTWKTDMNTMVKYTLFPFTDSWWNTSNIPGKKAENQNYILGIDVYEAACREKMSGWQGFEVVGSKAVQV
jgi:hypothetical protein